MNLTICGGGNLGHVVAGFAASHGHDVQLLTRHPERWSNDLTIDTPDGKTLVGHISGISNRPEDVIPQSDIILLCLPGYAIADCLKQIAPYLQVKGQSSKLKAVGSVVSSTGFFFEAFRIVPPSTPLFGFQRVPFIARVGTYGHSAHLLGYKPQLSLAVEQTDDAESLRQQTETLFQTPVQLLGSHYEVSLSNSNPLLHTSRLYSLFKDWHEGVSYARIPLFYEEWTEEAAELYIRMDNELQALLAQLPVRPGSIPTVLDYYESTDAPSLARKLRSIEAFKGIPAPMKSLSPRPSPSLGGDRGGPGSYVPDFQSRYFTEDFPYGLAIVHRLMHEKGIPSPTIDMVFDWGMAFLF